MKLFGLVILTAATSAFANGWTCLSEEGGWEVKLYDRVSTQATKSPAALIVSKDNELVALAYGKNIKMETQKSEFPGDTPSKEQKVYTVSGKSSFADTGDSMDVQSVVLKINGNQDKEKLSSSQRRAGSLELESGRGSEAAKSLNCKYYLKGAR